jgi:hypothetical protein
MKKLAVLTVVILAGCQTAPSLDQIQARAGNASNYDVCRAILLAPQDVAQIAQGEAQRRSLDCAPFADAVMQEQAQNNANRAAVAQQLLARPAAQPYQLQPYQMQPHIQPQVNCQSYRVGSTVQTHCQ